VRSFHNLLLAIFATVAVITRAPARYCTGYTGRRVFDFDVPFGVICDSVLCAREQFSMECDEEADEEKYSNSSERCYNNHSRHRYPLRQLHLGVGINYL
jgi:hypothetical protein